MTFAPYTTKSKVVITCSKRLAPYLEVEVRALGFVPDSVFQTGLLLQATMNECVTLNMNLRCASQVHYSLQSFRADHPDDLYRNLVDIPWETLLGADSEYVIQLGDDDVASPRLVELTVAALDASPSAGMAHSRFALIDDRESDAFCFFVVRSVPVYAFG